MTHSEIVDYLKTLAKADIACHSQRFFKTGVGEYGHGDQFLGIRVPVLRTAVKTYKNTPIDEVFLLLTSQYHEVRLFALLLMVYQFSKSNCENQQLIYQGYLSHTRYINNWDLVDSSAHHILGVWLLDKERTPLYELARSSSLWERRIAIIATLRFIKNEQFEDTLALSKILIMDNEDLIHKAVGWMLREVGKRDMVVEEGFLQQHYKQMPRTMLRYAIEKFTPIQRKAYLNGEH